MIAVLCVFFVCGATRAVPQSSDRESKPEPGRTYTLTKKDIIDSLRRRAISDPDSLPSLEEALSFAAALEETQSAPRKLKGIDEYFALGADLTSFEDDSTKSAGSRE